MWKTLEDATLKDPCPDECAAPCDESSPCELGNRFNHTASALPDGKVLIVGGHDNPDTIEFGGTAQTGQLYTPESADLTLQMSDGPDPGTVGQDLVYTISVTNAGPSRSESVRIADTLPEGVAFKSASVTQGPGACSPGLGAVTCELGDMDPSASAVVSITIVPTQAAPASSPLENRASVSGLAVDPRPGDNTALETTIVQGLEVTPGGPVVTGLSPACGPTEGGTSVAITGQRLSQALLVRFGDSVLLPLTGFSVRSDSEIVARSPSRAAGEAPVSVATTSGSSSPSAVAVFKYPCAALPGEDPPLPGDAGPFAPGDTSLKSLIVAPPTGGGFAPAPVTAPASAPLPGAAPGPGLSTAPGGGFTVAPQVQAVFPQLSESGAVSATPQGSLAPGMTGASWTEAEEEPAPGAQFYMVSPTTSGELPMTLFGVSALLLCSLSLGLLVPSRDAAMRATAPVHGGAAPPVAYK